MCNPQQIAAQADAAGRDQKLRCRYEYDRKHSEFRWNFYRRGIFVSGTNKPGEVMKKLERLMA